MITYGKNCVIEDMVKIGKGTVIGNNVVIHRGTVIGDNCRIDDNTVIGKRPMKSLLSATTDDSEISPCAIGNEVLIGANVVIYAGCEIKAHVLIADLASIREDVIVDEYTIVGRGVCVENHCRVGKRCKLETNVYLTAYSVVEDSVFIAPMVATSNDRYIGRTKERFGKYKGITIRKGGRIGVGAVILPGIIIGEDALVAAGAVVTHDVPAQKVVMGIPARVIRDVSPEQLLDEQDIR